ncbi:hypothetical protein DCAR_0518466 [Daucus carota subsp. sativus]|uniref:RING-type E3 ubiquitin transferase n=1 Tax=Daucus carota subsp. sativus TaxID=79200 RepID=A0A161YI50_DAUCS|nr:hypothetical protein DCAR_0518466 [Daucus carota subsp. sativus]
MSVVEAAAALLSKIAQAADGAVIGGAVLASVAVLSILDFASYSSALRKIKDAPSIRVSDLRSILSVSDHDSGDRKLVVVRGYVKAKSAVEGIWKTLGPRAIVSPHSGDKAVILLRTQTSICKVWRGLFGWTSERSVFTIPFILVDRGIWSNSDYVVVNINGSRHPLPLVTVHHHLQPITASPCTLLQAFFGHEYFVGLLEDEKILPLGKDITVVGMCGLSNKTLEIKSCKDLPFFMSDMTKEQMLVDLAFRTKVVLWSGVVVGSLAIGVLGYAAVRNWNKWKEWRQMRRIQRDNTDDSSEADTQIVRDEENGDIPEGELCAICLARRRRSAFIPCGHLLCCPRCALFLERKVSPKCPVCRQSIRTSVRIYDS